MRSRPELAHFAVALLALALAMLSPARAAENPPAPAEIDRAVQVVKADPNLAEETTVRTLRWNSDPEKEKKTREPTERHMPGWLRWLGDFFSWIAQSSRLLLWIILGALALVLVAFIARVFTANRLGVRGTRFIAPTHVRDLDIRPESLPEDIGAAARALWDRGEQRAALALLYRGLLSRLAHGFEVPIRDSSTEGDCLLLAARKLDEPRVAYATRLIRLWQRAIYGGLAPETADVHELCASFDARLTPPAAESSRRADFAPGAAT